MIQQNIWIQYGNWFWINTSWMSANLSSSCLQPCPSRLWRNLINGIKFIFGWMKLKLFWDIQVQWETSLLNLSSMSQRGQYRHLGGLWRTSGRARSYTFKSGSLRPLCFSVSLSFLWHSFMLPSRKREVGVSFIVNSSSFATESTESSSIQKHTLTWFSLSTMSVLTEYHDVTEKTYLIWPIRIFLFRKSTYSNQFMIESKWTFVAHLINSIKVFPRKRVHKKRTDNPQNIMPILQCLKMYAHTHSLTQCFSTLQETSKTCRTVFPEEQGWKTLV